MTDYLEVLTKGWTPGATGIYGILVLLLLGWWKGLPTVLDSWSKRLDAERIARLAAIKAEREHAEHEIARLERQIALADERHAECMDGQKAMRHEIAEMQVRHATEISRLQALISGMVMQMRQMQLSAIGEKIAPPSPEISALLRAINTGEPQ
jgi:hypothetical protein